MHARRRGRASGHRTRARRRRRALVRWFSAVNQSAAKQHKRHAHAGAAGATGQPARGRHAQRCAPADARSAGRGSGLAALPRPSQCRPEKGPVKNFKIGTRWAARRRGPAHALWCCAHGRGAAACDALLVSAARGVQRAQQGAARALFPILSPILFPIFGKANSRDFSSQKNINKNFFF